VVRGEKKKKKKSSFEKEGKDRSRGKDFVFALGKEKKAR